MREIVLDTETTGMIRGEDRVIEIGCVELQDLLPTGRTFHQYVNPEGRRVHPEALKVHGISDDFIKDKPAFKLIAPRFTSFVRGARLVAHNAPFDKGMLEEEFKRLGVTLEIEWIDTLPLARKVKKGGLHNLDALCKHYKISNLHRKLHGALLDSQLLSEVYLHLRGGRQFGFDLGEPPESETVVVDEDADLYGPQRMLRFKSRITDAEREAHAAFIASLKDPIWNDYATAREKFPLAA